jgi:peptidoglycan/LPS O-acetylase OafA/YrhL
VNAHSDRFPLMDSMRAIAALLVLGVHSLTLAGAADSTSALAPYTVRLEMGVVIFFLISGFLLYRPFVRAHAEGGRSPEVAGYAWRRFLRIAPAYWVALTVTALWLGARDVWSEAPLFYGFGQIYERGLEGGISPAWSLCIEVTFYFMLPVYALVIRRVARASWLRAEVTGLLTLVAVSVAWKAVLLADGPASAPLALGWLPAFLDHFALGMALAVASVRVAQAGEQGRALALLGRRPGLAWAGALIAFLAVARGIGMDGRAGPSTTFQAFAEHELYALVALLLLLPAVFGGGGLVRRVLGHRSLVFLGLVSYGLYLWQETWLAQLADWDVGHAGLGHQYLVVPLLGFAGTLVLAASSWYAVERPALSLRRLRVSAARRAAPAPGRS